MSMLVFCFFNCGQPPSRMMVNIGLMVVALFAVVSGQTDPSYDHQTTSYSAVHKPVVLPDMGAHVEMTPFFSPTSSISTLTKLVESATKR